MYYYDPNNDKSNARRWAGLAALLYALSIAAAFLFVSFDMGRDELLPGEGLLIDFGTTETGLGDRDLSATDVQAPPQQAAAEASRQQVEYVTSEREEIAVQTPQPEKKPRERETPGQTPQRSDAQQPAEQPRTVNRRALFPGRTVGALPRRRGLLRARVTPGTFRGRRKAVTTARARAIRALPTTFRGARWWENCPSLPIRAMSPARSSSM